MLDLILHRNHWMPAGGALNKWADKTETYLEKRKTRGRVSHMLSDDFQKFKWRKIKGQQGSGRGCGFVFNGLSDMIGIGLDFCSFTCHGGSRQWTRSSTLWHKEAESEYNTRHTFVRNISCWNKQEQQYFSNTQHPPLFSIFSISVFRCRDIA